MLTASGMRSALWSFAPVPRRESNVKKAAAKKKAAEKKATAKQAATSGRSVPAESAARAAKTPAAPQTPAATGRCWLFKSEPDAFSIDDLAAAPDRTTFWDGVRNYQARNMLRDDVAVGDRVLFYHSNTDPLCIAGTALVVEAGSPDPTAFDPADPHYDPKSRRAQPAWYGVRIRLAARFERPVTRAELAADPRTADMLVLRRGMRLSIQPVTDEEYAAVLDLAGVRA
jgi:predicted RNA-binding protein with PUA-like domain